MFRRPLSPQLAALVALVGCGSLYTRPAVGPDAGMDAGAPDSGADGGIDGGAGGDPDGGADGGVNDRPDGGAGGDPDGGADGGVNDRPDGGFDGGTDGGFDGGSADAGVDAGFQIDGGPFTFVSMAPPSERLFAGVHGTSATNIYAAASKLYRYDGQGWTAVLEGVGLVHAVRVTRDGAVFAAADTGLYHCFSACTNSAAFTLTTTLNTYPFALCGGDARNTVHALGYTIPGQVFRFDGASWTQLPPLGVQDPLYGCHYGQPQGELYVGTRGAILRFAGGSWTAETVDGGTAFDDWRAVHGVGDELHAAGDSRLVATRRPDAGWAMQLAPGGSGLLRFRTIGGRSPLELFALGDYYPGYQRARYDGQRWSFTSDLAVDLNVYGLWAVNENRYVVVGQATRPSVNGVVLLGTR